MSAIIYCRYSTDRQAEASIEDQLRVCREYAQTRGWTIAGEHTDAGISGAALGNRPGAKAAIDTLRGGDVLLVTDLSRLSRSQDLAPLLTRLRHRGARVIGVQDGYDSESRTARMQAGLSGIMSEEFRAMVADRTRSALELRARRGEATGGKAYGDPEIVREIFGRFAAGETMKAIASDLNRRGVPSPGADWAPRAGTRGRWLVSALHALLHNERYAGRLVWNRSRWIKDPDTGIRKRVERPESEWIVQDIDPLIDAATWARCQARFRSQPGRGGTPRYLLSGLLECALCGSKLIVAGGDQRRYVCSMYHGGGPHACANALSVPRQIAEERILAPVMEQLLSPEAIAEGVRQMREARVQAEHAPVDDRELRELERLVREGVLSREVAGPAIAEARRKAQEQRTARSSQGMPWPTPAAWREAVSRMREILTGRDVDAARECLRELIGTVRCVPAGDHVVAELAARHVVLATGTTGRWNGSGGLQWTQIRLPTSTRRHRPLVKTYHFV